MKSPFFSCLIYFKRLLAILFLFLFIPGIAQKTEQTNTLLWKISGNGLKKPSYLYGTIHLKDKRVFNFSDSLLYRLEECEAFAMETNMDSIMPALFGEKRAGNDTVNWYRKKLSSSTYDSLSRKLENEAGFSLDQIGNRDIRLLRKFVNTVKEKEDDRPTFLDVYLANIAERQGKTVYGLEEYNEHLEILSKLKRSSEINEDEVKEWLSKKNSNLIEEMVKLYQEEKLKELYEKAIQGRSEEFEEALITKRNVIMADNMDSIMRLHSLFTAVGAAHLPGKEGIIELLKRKGYKVEALKYPKTGLVWKYVPEYTELPWHVNAYPDKGFQLSTPGKMFPLDLKNDLIKMNVYLDIGTGIYYYSLGIASPILNEGQEEKFFDSMEKGFSMKGAKIQKRQTIQFAGCKAMELTYKMGFYNGSIKAVVKGKMVYLLMALYHKNTLYLQDIDRFFNSFSLTGQIAQHGEHFISSSGAFEVDFPDTPTENVPEIGEEDSKTELHQYIASDNSNGAQLLIQYFDLMEGKAYQEDSVVLSLITDHYLESIGEAKLDHMEKKKINTAGIPGLQIRADFSDGSSLFTQHWLRNTRVYLLMAIATKTEMDKGIGQRFFDSFRLREFKYNPLREYVSADSTFYISAPEPMHVYLSDTSYFSKDIETTYVSFDEGSGNSYYFSITQKPPYYSVANDSLLFEEQKKEIKGFGDSILDLQCENSNGYRSLLFTLKQRKTETIKRYRIWYRNNAVYKLHAALHPRDMHSLYNEAFFSVPRINQSSDTKALFRRKTEELLTDLTSIDTLKRQAAEKYLVNYSFEKNELPLLYRALSKDYWNDTVSGNMTTKSRLYSSLIDVSDSSTLHFVLEHMAKERNHPAVISAQLRAISGLKTKAAVTALKSLLLNDSLCRANVTYSMFSNLEDTLPLAVSLYPELLSIASDTAMEYGLLSLTNALLDSGLLKASDVVLYLKPFQSFLNSQLAKEENKKNGYVNEMLFELLSYHPDAVSKELANRALLAKSKSIQFKAAKCLLKANQPVASKVLNALAEDDEYRLDLYRSMEKLHKLELFPAKYATQEKLAVSEVNAALYDYEIYDTKAVLVKEISVVFDGKSATVYVYKVKVNWSKKDIVFYAGPYFKDQPGLQTAGERTGSSLQEFSKKADFVELWKEYVSEER